MAEVKGAASIRSPGHEKSQRGGPFCRDSKDVCSKGNRSMGEKEEDRHPHEKQRNTGSLRTPEDSPKRQGHTKSSEEAKYSRQKRKSPCGSPLRHNENGNLEKKMKGSAHPARQQGKGKPLLTTADQHSRGGSLHTKPYHKDQMSQPRSQSRTTYQRRSKHIPEAWRKSLQAHRHHSPEARRPGQLFPLSRLSTHMDALVEAMGELQTPGGAFLRVPAHSTEPTASQRAWLTWQLAHAGASLYGALIKVNSMLAAQSWPPDMSAEPSRHVQGHVYCPRDHQTSPYTPCPPTDGSSLYQN